MKMRKSFCVSLALLLVLSLAGCGPSKEERWTEQYETAMHYLEDGSYEEAVIAFTSAIEIDESRAPAYAGRSQSYRGLADVVRSGGTVELLSEYEDQDSAAAFCFEQAVRDLEKALELDPENVEYYNSIIALTLEYGDLEAMIAWAQKKFEHTDDTEYKDLLDSAQTGWALMDQLAAAFESGEDENVFALMHGEDYQELLTLQQYLGRPVLRVYGENTLGCYPLDSASIYGNFMLYYGAMEDGIRSGHGSWYGYSNGNNYASSGDWSGDAPNGSFETKEWNSSLDESVTYRIVSGNVSDGLWNGDVIWAFDTPDGYSSWQCSFINGIGVNVATGGGFFWSETTLEGEPGMLGPSEGEDEVNGIAGFCPEYS